MIVQRLVRTAELSSVSCRLLAAIAQVGLLSACSSPALSSIKEDGGGAHDGTFDVQVGDSSADDGFTHCNFPGCDAGPDVAYTLCPSMPPQPGTPCPAVGEQCEYGSDWWLGCNTLVQCASTGWEPAPSNPIAYCPVPDAGGTCPATWAEASTIDASALVCPARECQYPEGSCACLVNCGAAGMLHVEDLTGSWYCTPASNDCPSPRPDLGTPCAKPGWGCTYGRLCGCGTAITCVDGVWQGAPTAPCP